MKNAPFLNFEVDKANKQINVERDFDAPLNLVWDAWTKPEILDQWWAPKPWKAKTKSMDFTEGGSWLYVMVGPEGEEHWSLAEYKSIKPLKSFSGLDGFCDENGTINPKMPRSEWKNDFTETGDKTRVNINITFNELADLEKTIEMGFKEGFSAGMENLDEYLSTQAAKQKQA